VASNAGIKKNSGDKGKKIPPESVKVPSNAGIKKNSGKSKSTESEGRMIVTVVKNNWKQIGFRIIKYSLKNRKSDEKFGIQIGWCNKKFYDGVEEGDRLLSVDGDTVPEDKTAVDLKLWLQCIVYSRFKYHQEGDGGTTLKSVKMEKPNVGLLISMM
jgi:hypothetical protein